MARLPVKPFEHCVMSVEVSKRGWMWRIKLAKMLIRTACWLTGASFRTKGPNE